MQLGDADEYIRMGDVKKSIFSFIFWPSWPWRILSNHQIRL